MCNGRVLLASILVALIKAGTACAPAVTIVSQPNTRSLKNVDEVVEKKAELSPSKQRALTLLKTHLGLTPAAVEEQVKASAFSAYESVLAVQQLSCDFTDPSLCHWSNLEPVAESTTLTSDQEQFFLFEKVEDKKWPWLIVPQGNKRTPELGERLILTGHHGRPPVTSVFYSSPVQCLAPGAQLSLDYWIYGNAKARLLLLEPFTLKQLWKSSNSCTRLGDDGHCVFDLPDMSKMKAHLAVEAYDLFDGVILLDNVVVSGEFMDDCNLSSDLLFGTEVEAYEGAAEGEQLDDATLLACSQFKNCRWVLPKSSSGEWQLHSGTVDAAKWMYHTDSHKRPESQFLMALNNSSPARFISQGLECSTQDALVSMKLWTSKHATLKVCAVDDHTSLEELYCKTLTGNREPFQSVLLPEGLSDFRVILTADNYKDGLVAIDDLQVVSENCGTESLERSVRPISHVEATEEDAKLKVWRHTTKKQRVSADVPVIRPNEYIEDNEVKLEETIDRRPFEFTPDSKDEEGLWAKADKEAELVDQSEYDEELLLKEEELWQLAELSASTEEELLKLIDEQAENVDDEEIQRVISQRSLAVKKTEPKTKVTFPGTELECATVECDFEVDGCRYVVSSEEGVNDEVVDVDGELPENVRVLFMRAQGHFGNRATGVRSDDGSHYAAAYVLEGQTNTLSVDTLLADTRIISFRYYQAAKRVTLEACCDDECVWKSEEDLVVSFSQWMNAEMICPPETKKISFHCVNQLNSHNQGACGVDNIQLWKVPDPADLSVAPGPEPACKPRSNRERLLAQIDDLTDVEFAA